AARWTDPRAAAVAYGWGPGGDRGTVVGTHPGRGLGGARRLLPRTAVPPGPSIPLLQRRLRRARATARGPARSQLVRRRARRAALAPRDDPHDDPSEWARCAGPGGPPLRRPPSPGARARRRRDGPG